MTIILKILMYGFCAFAGLVCLAAVLQILDSLGIKKPIISALRRAWGATFSILRYTGDAIFYTWSLLHAAVEFLGIFTLYAIVLIIAGIFLYAAFKDADAWETVALTLALIL